MLTDYIQAAIDAITWRVMDDGSFHAEISQLGLSASSAHLEECQCRIREMLEDHIVISIHQHITLPAIGGKTLAIKEPPGRQVPAK